MQFLATLSKKHTDIHVKNQSLPNRVYRAAKGIVRGLNWAYF
jgi:hypothetical protein